MPTYEFECPNGHQFERFYRKISDGQGEVRCPVCDAVAVRRMSATGGLIFKGSGFYITDYGKDGKKAQPTSAAPAVGGDASSGASGASGGSGDSASSAPKPEAKPAESKPAPKSGESGASSPKPSGGSASKPSSSE